MLRRSWSLSLARLGTGAAGLCVLGCLATIAGVPGEERSVSAATAAVSPAFDDAPGLYVSDAGGFRIQFPGAPRESEQTAPTANGPMVVHMASFEAPDGAAYVVSYYDVSPAALQARGAAALLDAGMRGAMGSAKWSATNRTTIQLDGHLGREAFGEIQAPGAAGPLAARARIYLAGNRFYQIVLVGPPAQAAPADFDTCLGSFQIASDAPAVARNGPAPPPVARSHSPAPAAPGPAMAGPGHWVEYVSLEGGYSIRLPVMPQQTGTRTVQANSKRAVLHAATCIAPDQMVYVVTFADVPLEEVQSSGPDVMLDSCLQGMVNTVGWTVVSKKAIQLDGHPGRDVVVRPANPGQTTVGDGRTRLFLSGARIYQIVISRKGGPLLNADAEACLASFRFRKGGPIAVRHEPNQGRRSMLQGPAARPSGPGPDAGAGPNDLAAETNAPGPDESNGAGDGMGPDPSQPARIAIRLKPGRSRLFDLPSDGARRGGPDERFRQLAPQGGVLVGVRVGYVNAFGGRKTGSIQPIFQVGGSYMEGERKGARNTIDEITVMAKPGYAVGGANVRAGLLVDAFQLVFMKFQSGKLDPRKAYLSDWIGDPGGGNPAALSGRGRPVVGIFGSANERWVNSLGVVVKE